MNIEKFSKGQVKPLIVMFILGTSLIVSGGSDAKESEWISILLAMLASIPLVLIYSKLLKLFPGKGLYEILLSVYGKFLGKVLIFLYSFYFFHLSAISLRNVTEYVQVVSFPDTPQYITGIFLVALTLYSISAGFNVIATWAKKVLPFIIAMLVITIILGIPQYNYSHLTPMMYEGLEPVLKSGFTLLTFPFGETVVFMVFLGFLYNKEKPSKIYIMSILIGGVFLLLTGIRNILLLGFPNLGNVYFPSHYSTSLINIRTFIQRIEILVSMNLILSAYIKITICLYAAIIGIVKLFNIKKNKTINIISPIMSIALIPISIMIYKSTMEMFRFIDYYKYYAIPFQIAFPILTLIIALIRRKAK